MKVSRPFLKRPHDTKQEFLRYFNKSVKTIFISWPIKNDLRAQVF